MPYIIPRIYTNGMFIDNYIMQQIKIINECTKLTLKPDNIIRSHDSFCFKYLLQGFNGYDACMEMYKLP